ncbi:hypothetical protein [Metabacillus sp. 84]|uniref:hypothetical protein n=1 Tax=Metabacillus sp. 84 TaxID=3404705 RepID=UPI003CF72668
MKKWIAAGTAMMLAIPAMAFASESSEMPKQEFSNEESAGKKDRQQLKKRADEIVKEYAPEKQEEFKEAAEENKRLTKQLRSGQEEQLNRKERLQAKVKDWKTQGLSDQEIKEKVSAFKEKRKANRSSRKESAEDLRTAIKNKDEALIKKLLDEKLKSMQDRNEKLEKRLAEKVK